MNSKVIAIDLGATSGRMIVAGMENGKLKMDEVNRFANAIYEKQGKFYWNLDNLFESIKEGLNTVSKMGVKISSIGVDTWGVDVAFIDSEGNVIEHPRAYRDPYTQGAKEEYFEKISKQEVYDRTGIQFLDFNTLFQLYAAKREGYEPMQKANKILFMPDLISYLLTGKAVCEYTILSTSQFLNPNTKQIDSKLVGEAGVDLGKFPEVVMPGHHIGMLNDSLLEHPFGYEIPVVAVAGHDTASAVAAVPANNERFAYLSSGTWSLMGIEVKDPIINESSAKMNFTNEGGVEGTTRFLKNITGMWILEQCRKEWGAAGKSYSYPEIVSMIEGAERFRSFINPDDASFANPTSMLEAIDNYCIKNNMPKPETDSQVVRLIMESLALRYRTIFEYLKEMAPFSLDCLHIIGGGAKNNILNQFTSNSLGVKVVAGPSEATAIGNVMIQLKSLGIAKDMVSMRELIEKSVDTATFEPCDTELWQQAYERYTQHCN